MVRRIRRGAARARVSRRGVGGSFGKVGVNFSPSFLIGAVAGYMHLSDAIPQEMVLATAVAPVSGIGMVKGAAQGVVVGNLASKYMGGNGASTISAGFAGE